MKVKLDAIRDCLEGVVPGNIATCAIDGTPNVAHLSQVQYVDSDHVALSYQFFTTTRRNILAFPYARLAVISPLTAAHYRLSLNYLRTECQGPLFETMKARLTGIASHTGMSGVFRLLGSDVYRVLDIEQVHGQSLPSPRPACNLLAALRTSTVRLCACGDLDTLLAELLTCLESCFDIHHCMVLMLDGSGEHLYTVATCGYPESGIGSEINVGDGVIGVAARERTPIRIGHFSAEYTYCRAIRESLVESGLVSATATEIPLPGLQQSRSQMALPIHASQRLIGVLYVESPLDLRFTYDDEDALVALTGQLGAAIRLLQQGHDERGETGGGDAIGEALVPAPWLSCEPLVIRHYAENDSVFLNGDYLIKGVAGSILWALVCDYAEKGRCHFSNRELRLDPRIRLPDISDNLEARLILLARRLREHNAPLRMEKTGRGRFRLQVDQPLRLIDVPENV